MTKRQRGMTFIELIASLAIISLVAAGLSQLMAGQLRHVARQEAMVERRQEGRAVVALLLSELRLAGFPGRPDPVCHVIPGGIDVGPSSVRFLANLHGVATRLAGPAAAGDAALSIPDNNRIRDGGLTVSPGAAFEAGDAIYLYDRGLIDDPGDDRVECHRLDRGGRSGRIELAAGDRLRGTFLAGSRIQVVNLVRYAHAPETRQLVRSVDGAAQAVADHVADVRFSLRGGGVAAELVMEPRRIVAGPMVAGAVWHVLVTPRNGVEGEGP
jgi:prepilin-type N-terminal cleavage/methylation domain-containing protein